LSARESVEPVRFRSLSDNANQQRARPMVSFRLARRSRSFRINAWVAVGLLAAFGAYVLTLTQIQQTTERTYAELRNTDPDLYLAKIRQAEGFRVYLRLFTELKGYQTPQTEAPPFLIGRWVLHDEPMRVDDAYVPPICLDDIVIQDGNIRTGRPRRTSYPVRYQIQGTNVIAVRENAAPIVIVPVGYGTHVNHIEVKLPGSDKTRYGYECK
jgi:hypothetical protein